MKVEINIECGDDADLIKHLKMIIEEIKCEREEQEGRIVFPVILEDEQASGKHTCNVVPECTTEHFPDALGFCVSCGEQIGSKVIIQ